MKIPNMQNQTTERPLTPSPFLLSVIEGKRTKDNPILPLDADAAASVILAKLSTGDITDTAEAFSALTKHNKNLADGDGLSIRITLARQICVLEAIFNNMALKAAATTSSNHKATLFRTAISAQQAALRTLALLGSMGMRDVT